MIRFRFRFENVVRYRKIIEENKTRDLSIALRYLKNEETNLERIERAISINEEAMEQSSHGRISAYDLINKFNYLRVLDEKKVNQKKQVINAEEEMNSKRNELIEATKKKKILERLKERDYEAYQEALRKEEQVFLDELSSHHFKNHPEH